MQGPPELHAVPLNERRQDRWFIAMFSMFALTSVFIDRLSALDVDVCGEQRLAGALCWYGQHIDPLYLANPQWLRVMSGISAWVFGPLYLLMAWAFWRGVETIRGPAVAWAVAMIYSLIVHLWMEVFGDHPPPSAALMFAIYLPYLILPFAVLWRLRNPRPFTKASV